MAGVVGNRSIVNENGRALVDTPPSILWYWNTTENRLSCVQEIATAGSRTWHHFSMKGRDFLAVANFRSPRTDGGWTTRTFTEIYGLAPSQDRAPTSAGGSRCAGDSPLGRAPIDTRTRTRLPTVGASALITFAMNSSAIGGEMLYLVVASYHDSETSVQPQSKVYMLGAPVGDTGMAEVGVESALKWPICSDTFGRLQPDTSHCFPSFAGDLEASHDFCDLKAARANSQTSAGSFCRGV